MAAHWFAAEILHSVVGRKITVGKVVYRSVVLVRAASVAEATRQAARIGRNGESTPGDVSVDGHPARMRFEGVRSLYELGANVRSGAEAFCEELSFRSADGFRRFKNLRTASVTLTDSRPYRLPEPTRRNSKRYRAIQSEANDLAGRSWKRADGLLAEAQRDAVAAGDSRWSERLLIHRAFLAARRRPETAISLLMTARRPSAKLRYFRGTLLARIDRRAAARELTTVARDRSAQKNLRKAAKNAIERLRDGRYIA